MISLKEITKENYDKLINLSVNLHQKEYISTVEKSLSLAYAYKENVYPFAIYYEDIVVGFIMCRYNVEYNNYFIWQFFIDKKHQGKGYGKESLFSIIEWIKSQANSCEVITTVIKGNKTAERLYKSIGFVNMDNGCSSEIDLRYIIE